MVEGHFRAHARALWVDPRGTPAAVIGGTPRTAACKMRTKRVSAALPGGARRRRFVAVARSERRVIARARSSSPSPPLEDRGVPDPSNPRSDPTSTPSGQWSVSTRTVGEVLTTEVRSHSLRVLLFSNASSDIAIEIERRVGDLFDSDGPADLGAHGPRSIPGPLRHATLALLDLVGELERLSGC